MGVMKREVLFGLVLSVLLTMPAYSAVTVEQTTDAEYLINSGYSQTTAEQVFILKNRSTGKPAEPLYEKSQNVFVRGWQKFYSYLDPAQEQFDTLHHDIQMSPKPSDL